MTDNRIELENEADFRRAVEIERELITKTNWQPPKPDKYVTFPVSELADAVREQLNEEGIKYR